MNVYRVIEGERPSYFGTRDEAHRVAKAPGVSTSTRIELVNFTVTQFGLLMLLNHDWTSDQLPGEVLRTWRLSPRGGLVECPNGE